MRSPRDVLPTLLTLMSLLPVVACSPSPDAIRKAVDERPEILFAAMERHPEAFMQTFGRAAEAARAAEAKRMQEQEAAQRAAELAAPLRPAVDESRPIAGDRAAPITIVEYSDFECPYCRAGAATIEELLERYPGTVRIILKHTPNARSHRHATAAARYYEAAALQDPAKALELRRRLFRRQDDLAVDGEVVLREEAAALGLDRARLVRDVAGPIVAERLAADSAEAAAFGFSGTPVYLVDGISIRGAYPIDEFVALVERRLAGDPLAVSRREPASGVAAASCVGGTAPGRGAHCRTSPAPSAP